MVDREMLINAAIGAVVNIVASFVLGPLGPILGGGAAGYLQRQRGLTVGALSGVIAALPLVVVIFLGASLFFFVPDPAVVGVGIVISVIIFLATVFVSAALGALGGYLGVYLATETDLGQ